MPEAVWCQIKESSAPVELGFKHCICSARSGKSSSILCLFHLSSEVSRSATVRSRADSLIGPIGFRILSNEIQESFQILVVCPFPIDFPRFSFKGLAHGVYSSIHGNSSARVLSLGNSCCGNIFP